MTTITVSLILIAAAFLVTIAAAMGRAPLWVSVLLLCVAALLGLRPQ